MTRQEVIQELKDQGLHVFPVVKKAAIMKNWQKEIYTGEITSENFGVRMGDNFIICIDVDDIELLPFFEYLKDKTYMVKTGNGFHIYIKVNEVGKVLRLDNEYGQHIDIQTTGTYVIGEGSTHYDKQGNATGKMYELLSKDRKINEIPFEPIKDILEDLGFFKYSKEANYKMRQRFLKDKLPTKGTSNSFYFNAALECNTDRLSREEATEKIKLNYDQWVNLPTFSNRPWSNIETTINKVYDENLTIQHGGHNKADDTSEWKKQLFEERKIFSDIPSKTVYENKDGFLKPINEELHREMVLWDNDLTPKNFNATMFQILGQAQKVPEKDPDRIVFTNGTFRPSTGKIEDTDLDKLAFLGFEDFEYIENPECPKFLDVIFSGVPEKQHPQIKAGLRDIFIPKLTSEISIIHGLSGSGKSTGLQIIGEILGDEYYLPVEPKDFFDDKFIGAKIKDKLLVYFLDMPQEFDKFMNAIKVLTGESKQTKRGFFQDAETNIKIISKCWGATNNLFSIPEHEKDPMFNRRLSLITKDIPKKPYPNNTEYYKEVAKEEGSHIISWILNLTDDECQYEPKEIIQPLWEKISDPEERWLKENFEFNAIAEENSLVKLVEDFENETKSKTNAIVMEKLLKLKGYPVRTGIIRKLKRKSSLENVKTSQNTNEVLM